MTYGPNPGAGPGRGKTSAAADLSKDERYEFRLVSSFAGRESGAGGRETTGISGN